MLIPALCTNVGLDHWNRVFKSNVESLINFRANLVHQLVVTEFASRQAKICRIQLNQVYCRSRGVVLRVVTRTFSDGRTDGRTMAMGASVTWTHCSVLFEVTWGKTRTSARTGSVPAMDAKGLYKGSSNIPSSPWPREATVCLVHFVVWAAIGGSFLGHTCRCSANQVFLY
jgi:hypothetical protein